MSENKKLELSDGARVYKVIDVVGTSKQNYEDAIRNAVRQASRSLEGLAWFEVSELRGLIQGGDVAEFQASLKVGFRLRSEG